MLFKWQNYRILPFFLGVSLLLFTACSRESSGYPQDTEAATSGAIPGRYEKLETLVPTAQDRNIARLVGFAMNGNHYSGKKLNDEISERAFDLYIKALDPMKMYFYQSDIDEFSKFKKTIDESIMKGDVSLGFNIYNRFLERVDERLDLIQNKLLKETYDFTADDEMIRDKDLMQYAKTPEEAQERWRKRVKFDILMLKAEARDKEKKRTEDTNSVSGKATEEDPIVRLQRRYSSLQKRMHQTSNDEVLETYLTAVTNAFDPHSSYMSPSSYSNFMLDIARKLEGIGASLQSIDGYTIVKKLVPGGAAEKDGRLKLEDKIVGVGQGKNGPIEDVVDMKLSDVVKKIRGDKGTIVRLAVLPDDGSDKKIIDITREQIALEDCTSEIFEVGKKADGKPFKIGVIDLPSFYLDMDEANKGVRNYKSTTRDMRKILKDFIEKEVDAVVLDLRLNGGGSLPEAVNATGLFIETGPVVQVKSGDASRPLLDTDSSVEWTGPLTVLTSKFSASASEIFAGAIKDYGRGLVIGDSTTHGKGTVQTMTDLNERFGIGKAGDLGALKLTIQMFFRPGGASSQIEGIPSDIELPSLTNHIEGVSESDLDYPLPFQKINAVKYPTFPYITADLVKELRKRSAARIAEEKDFLKTIHKIDQYLEEKNKKTQTLNEEKFFADRDRFNEDKETENIAEKMTDRKIQRDFYLEEVMAITVDGINILKEENVNYPKEKSIPGKRGDLFNSIFGG